MTAQPDDEQVAKVAREIDEEEKAAQEMVLAIFAPLYEDQELAAEHASEAVADELDTLRLNRRDLLVAARWHLAAVGAARAQERERCAEKLDSEARVEDAFIANKGGGSPPWKAEALNNSKARRSAFRRGASAVRALGTSAEVNGWAQFVHPSARSTRATGRRSAPRFGSALAVAVNARVSVDSIAQRPARDVAPNRTGTRRRSRAAW